MLKVNAVIIVRYESDGIKLRDLTSILNSEHSVYVYDNSVNPCTLDDSIYYYHDQNNSGLAVALNHCIAQAIVDGIELCVYFDQDSDANLELVRGLFNSYQTIESEQHKIFAVGPRPLDPSGVPYEVHCDHDDGSDQLEAREIITSGMTFRPEVVAELDYFDVRLYLDLVDFELCWRAREKGFKVYVDNTLYMPHEVGYDVIKFFGRSLPLSSPLRNYYQMRNLVFLLSHNRKKLGIRVVYYFFRRVFNVLLNILLADHRKERISYNWQGVVDGIKGKMGKKAK
jgi:rhamnosyltransferase